MKANFIWGVADDILRSTFKASEYGEVILPFVVMRRLDCVHEPYVEQVADFYEKNRSKITDDSAVDQALRQQTEGIGFANRSGLTFPLMAQSPQSIGGDFSSYRAGFTENIREILEAYQLDPIISKLERDGSLFLMVERFAGLDLGPDAVSNHATPRAKSWG